VHGLVILILTHESLKALNTAHAEEAKRSNLNLAASENELAKKRVHLLIEALNHLNAIFLSAVVLP
jgi:hypothetical protein